MLPAIIFVIGILISLAISAIFHYLAHQSVRNSLVAGIVSLVLTVFGAVLIYRHESSSKIANSPAETVRKEEALSAEQTWHPPVTQATHSLEGDKVRLSFFIGRESRAFASEIMCSVTDPNNQLYWSGTSDPSVAASAEAVSSFWFNVWYPDSFEGAPSLRPGTYKVHWFIATDSKQVIATDSFEVPEKTRQ
jgi:uncharacterized protein YxeA